LTFKLADIASRSLEFERLIFQIGVRRWKLELA
jgi:hypothetical protein